MSMEPVRRKPDKIEGGKPMKKLIALILVALIALASVSAFAEGKLVLYYSHAAEWSDPIIQGFEEKYGRKAKYDNKNPIDLG